MDTIAWPHASMFEIKNPANPVGSKGVVNLMTHACYLLTLGATANMWCNTLLDPATIISWLYGPIIPPRLYSSSSSNGGLGGHACGDAPHEPCICAPLQLPVLRRTDAPVHGLAELGMPLLLAVPALVAGWLAEAALAAVLAVDVLPLLLLTQTAEP